MHTRFSCGCVMIMKSLRQKNFEQPVKVSSKINFLPLPHSSSLIYLIFSTLKQFFLPTRLISQLIAIKFFLYSRRERREQLHTHMIVKWIVKLKKVPTTFEHAKESNCKAMNGKREKMCENENSHDNLKKRITAKKFSSCLWNTRAENFTILFCFALEKFLKNPPWYI